MLEYVFFHKVLAVKFSDKAKTFNIETILVKEDPAWEVHLPEDIDEKIEQSLSDYYDELFDQDQELYEQKSSKSEDEYGAAAIELVLKDGNKVFAQTDQKIMGKVLSVLDFDELNQLMNDIVFAVENPDERTICQRYRNLKEMEE